MVRPTSDISKPETTTVVIVQSVSVYGKCPKISYTKIANKLT